MKKTLLAAVAVSILSTGASFATTLTGLFSVEAVNITMRTGAQSEATLSDMQDAIAAGGATDSFTYNGALNFKTTTSSDSTTILQWFDSITPGGVSGMDATFGGLQLSTDDIGNGTATTTFLKFTYLSTDLRVGNFFGRHDDGIALYTDGVRFGGRLGPNGEKPFDANSVSDGTFSLLYVATNGNPSVLNVNTTAAAVPLPAAGWLLLAGVGGLAALRRRQRAA